MGFAHEYTYQVCEFRMLIMHCVPAIREGGSVLYLGMAKEILILPSYVLAG